MLHQNNIAANFLLLYRFELLWFEGRLAQLFYQPVGGAVAVRLRTLTIDKVINILRANIDRKKFAVNNGFVSLSYHHSVGR